MVYTLDEQFVNSIRVLVSDADVRKQWLGMLLLSKTFQPRFFTIDEALFTKNLNSILHSISNIVSKNDLFSDISVVATRAWKSTTCMLSHLYD